METCDDEFVAAAQDFIRRQEKAGKPWFVWLNTTHMHVYTHTKKRSLGQAGRWQSPYHDTMIDHDKNVGQMLDFLDKMGIAENTFVQYSTDNGPHRNTWPDAGTTPFRSQKNTNWEEAFRVPLLVRWPGKIKAGTISNEIVQHHDWMPTFLAMAGASDVIENLLPYLTGKEKTDPFEYATVTSNTYYEWMFHHAYLAYAAQAVTGKFLETFREFPAVQKPNTFTIDQAMEKMSQSASGGN
jgi:arylsulfatase